MRQTNKTNKTRAKQLTKKHTHKTKPHNLMKHNKTTQANKHKTNKKKNHQTTTERNKDKPNTIKNTTHKKQATQTIEIKKHTQ